MSFNYLGLFPFCLKEGTPPETGIDTEYPIGIPLGLYMKWFWRVRTWEVTGSSTGSETWTYEGTGDPGYNNWTTTGYIQDVNWSEAIARPEDLSCLSYSREIVWAFKAHLDRDDGPEDTDIYTLMYFFAEAYLNGNTIYPRILLANGWYSTAKGGEKVQAKLDPASTLYIDGVKIPCHIGWFPGREYRPDWNWTGKQEFNINPKTYWA